MDYKLINIAIIAFIIFLVYMTSSFWFGIIKLILKIMTPFLFAFALAHALYPLLKGMQRKGIPKMLGIAIISIVMFGLFFLIIWLVVPLSLEQISGLYSAITKFIQDISTHYDVNLGPIQQSLAEIFNPILENLSKYISNGTWTVVNTSITAIIMLIIVMFVAIYFLTDMEMIRHKLGSYLKLTDTKTFNYVKVIDYEMNQYFLGLGKVLVWQLFEYTLAFYLIGHPNYLLLGVLASITTVVPYVGAWMTNIIAGITAFVISPHLFLLTVIAIAILSIIDSYVVSPRVFGKTNRIPPIVTIFAVFAGGIIYGMMGIIISLPLTIILISTFKYYRQDILQKIGK
jgi:predicted PurR-regulated permease PerM